MPVNFYTHESVVERAKLRGAREPLENETPEDYRAFIADEVGKVDPVEGVEIRTGLGWDKQNPMALLWGIRIS